MDLLLPVSLMFNNITKIYFTNATGVNIYIWWEIPYWMEITMKNFISKVGGT